MVDATLKYQKSKTLGRRKPAFAAKGFRRMSPVWAAGDFQVASARRGSRMGRERVVLELQTFQTSEMLPSFLWNHGRPLSQATGDGCCLLAGLHR